MPLTSKQTRLAQKIDEWVQGIERRGGGEKEILEGMYDYMGTFKKLLDISSQEQMDLLAAKYAGFRRFALTLQDLAGGIQNGTIKVPR